MEIGCCLKTINTSDDQNTVLKILFFPKSLLCNFRANLFCHLYFKLGLKDVFCLQNGLLGLFVLAAFMVFLYTQYLEEKNKSSKKISDSKF